MNIKDILKDESKVLKVLNDLINVLHKDPSEIVLYFESLFRFDDEDFILRLYAVMLRKTDHAMSGKIVKSVTNKMHNFDVVDDVGEQFSPSTKFLIEILDYFWIPLVVSFDSEPSRWEQWAPLKTKTFDCIREQ